MNTVRIVANRKLYPDGVTPPADPTAKPAGVPGVVKFGPGWEMVSVRTEQQRITLPCKAGPTSIEYQTPDKKPLDPPMVTVVFETPEGDWTLQTRGLPPRGIKPADLVLRKIRSVKEGTILVFDGGFSCQITDASEWTMKPVSEAVRLDRRIALQNRIEQAREREKQDAERAKAPAVTRAAAMAADTIEDAVRALQSAFPDLTTKELHAGMMHARKVRWEDIERAVGSKATASKYIKRFYEKTGWTRTDRRASMGKRVSFDESRDTARGMFANTANTDEDPADID